MTSMFMLYLLTLLFHFRAVCASVYIGFPFEQQLPNVARIGETYKFEINPQTFKSDNPDNKGITYQAFQLPSWLSFDSSSLTFTGSPTVDDPIGNIDFILQGTDINNSLNQSCTIYLSNQPSPQLNPADSIQMQLKNFGDTNGYSGLVLEPQQPFSFSFNKDTFIIPSSSDNQIVAYYGKSANKTSLPSWCFFDESSLTFSGTTPPVNSKDAPSLQFDLTLIATDYAGFSAAYSTFRIVVGGHTLYIRNSTNYSQTVMTNAGDSVTIDLPIDDIYLDEAQIQPSQISKVVAYDAPEWVSVVDNTKLVANVPSDQKDNLVVNVTLFDIYQDSVYMNFGINVIHDIFSVDTINNVTATPGELFEYTIPDSYFKNKTATDITASFDETWLTFYHSNNTFIGMVPNDFKVADIELEATMNSLTQKLSFFIVSKERSSSSSQISSKTSSQSSSRSSNASSTRFNSQSTMSTSTRSSSSSRTASVTTSSSTTPSTSSSLNGAIVPNNKSTSSNKKALAIGLGVGIPVLAIIIAALIFFFCCCAKRRKDKDSDDDNGELSGDAMEKNDTNDTLVVNGKSAALAQKNLEELEKNADDQTSYYSNTQSTLTDKSGSSFYHDANNQISTDQLLGGAKAAHIGANDGEVLNSWRQSSTGAFKARDSLNSLATVATSDLLTVNVVNDDKVRKSQMMLPVRSKLRDTSSDSLTQHGNNSTNNHNSSSQYSSNLEPLRETDDNNVYDENNFSRDTSYGTMSTEAQLVGFNNSGSLYRNEQPEQQSYHGELSSISGDENDFNSQSSNRSDIYNRNRL